MLPLPCPCMTRTSCFMLRITPRTFVSNVAGIAVRGLLCDRANLAFSASIVHSDIETAKPCDGLVDQSADVILLAHIGVNELGLRTERAQLLNERLAGLLTPTGNDHLRALLAKATAAARPMPVNPPVIKTT